MSEYKDQVKLLEMERCTVNYRRLRHVLEHLLEANGLSRNITSNNSLRHVFAVHRTIHVCCRAHIFSLPDLSVCIVGQWRLLLSSALSSTLEYLKKKLTTTWCDWLHRAIQEMDLGTFVSALVTGVPFSKLRHADLEGESFCRKANKRRDLVVLSYFAGRYRLQSTYQWW